MEAVLNFFSDLILFTAGLAVILVWIVIFIGIWIELKDAATEIFGRSQSTTPDEDWDYPENDIR